MRARCVVSVAVSLVLLTAAVLLSGCWYAGEGEMGQRRTGATATTPSVEPTVASVKLLEIGNVYGIKQGAKAPTFTLAKPATVTEILDYHYIGGGGPTPGTIGLKDTKTGKVYGPWKSVGLDGQGGVKNAFWDAKMSELIPAGAYTVVDSDPSTWSTNDRAKGLGFVTVLGYYAK